MDVRHKYPALQTGIYWPVSLGSDALWSFQRTHARGHESQLLWVVHNLSSGTIVLSDSSSQTQLSAGTWYVFDAFDESYVGEIHVSEGGRVSQWNGNFSIASTASALWLLSPNRQLQRSEVPRNAVRVYPNPSSDIIFISGEASLRRIIVLDILGRRAFTEECDCDMNTKIDVEGLSKGWYLLQIQTDAGITVSKVLVE